MRHDTGTQLPLRSNPTLDMGDVVSQVAKAPIGRPQDYELDKPFERLMDSAGDDQEADSCLAHSETNSLRSYLVGLSSNISRHLPQSPTPWVYDELTIFLDLLSSA